MCLSCLDVYAEYFSFVFGFLFGVVFTVVSVPVAQFCCTLLILPLWPGACNAVI